jgi:hypothetical protein
VFLLNRSQRKGTRRGNIIADTFWYVCVLLSVLPIYQWREVKTKETESKDKTTTILQQRDKDSILQTETNYGKTANNSSHSPYFREVVPLRFNSMSSHARAAVSAVDTGRSPFPGKGERTHRTPSTGGGQLVRKSLQDLVEFLRLGRRDIITYLQQVTLYKYATVVFSCLLCRCIFAYQHIFNSAFSEGRRFLHLSARPGVCADCRPSPLRPDST